MAHGLTLNWWQELEPQWKTAFKEVFFGEEPPRAEQLEELFQSPALRIAGPRAPYPNVSLELTNITGIGKLPNLETLVITHHKITSITEVSSLGKLKHLFLFNNQIESLAGIEDLTHLQQLYVQFNKISSLEPIRKLHQLREIYVHDNNISSLEGLTQEHAEKVEVFFCRPNENLKQKEVFRVERELGIECRRL